MTPLTSARQSTIATVVRSIVYGVYISAFTICMRILWKRNKASQRYNLFANLLLFILASINLLADTSLDISERCSQMAEPFDECATLPITAMPPYLGLSSSLIADTILIWRCYIVWDRNWKFIFLPSLLTGFHIPAFFVNKGSIASIGIIGIATSNVLLSLLIAFRIFSIYREVSQYLGKKSRNVQRIVLAATLESGLVYSTFLVTLAVFLGDNQSRRHPQIGIILTRIWSSLAGITASIVIVRVTLDIAFNDLRTEMMTAGALETDLPTSLSQSKAVDHSPRAEEGRSDLNEVIIIGHDIESGQSRT